MPIRSRFLLCLPLRYRFCPLNHQTKHRRNSGRGLTDRNGVAIDTSFSRPELEASKSTKLRGVHSLDFPTRSHHIGLFFYAGKAAPIVRKAFLPGRGFGPMSMTPF